MERAMVEKKAAEDPSAKRVLAALDHRLARPPTGGYSTDEILAMMKQKTAELEKSSPRKEPRRRRVWIWGGAGLAALSAAAASLLVLLQPFVHVVELERLPLIEYAPSAEAPSGPLPPVPAGLEVTAEIHSGRLELNVPRLPTDIYTAVAVLDAKHRHWLAQSGDQLDPSCKPSCGKLKLRVALDRLPPGIFQVAVLVSQKPIPRNDVTVFLLDGDARRLRVRAFAMKEVVR